MNPRMDAPRAGRGPLRPAFVALIIAAFFLVSVGDADAQRRKRRKGKRAKPAPAAAKAKKPKQPPKLDFSGMDLEGRLRTPQLLYFLERASAELKAASLERRSFIPEMVRSLDEEQL